MPLEPTRIVPAGIVAETLRKRIKKKKDTPDDWNPSPFDLPDAVETEANQKRVELYLLITNLLEEVRRAMRTAHAGELGLLLEGDFERFRDTLRPYIVRIEWLFEALVKSQEIRTLSKAGFNQPPFPAAPSPVESALAWCKLNAIEPSVWCALKHPSDPLSKAYTSIWVKQPVPSAVEMAHLYNHLQDQIFPGMHLGELREQDQTLHKLRDNRKPATTPVGQPLPEMWTKFMSKKEIAKIFDIDVDTLRIWEKKGQVELRRSSRQRWQVRVDTLVSPYRELFAKHVAGQSPG